MIIFVGTGRIDNIDSPSIKNYFVTIGDRTRLVMVVSLLQPSAPPTTG